MPSSPPLKLVIIGAGIAGLACARVLANHDLPFKILEKSRGLGGRVATRRVGDDITFDHGAQFVTARTDDFKSFIKSAMDQGACQAWTPIAGGPAKPDTTDWITGQPGMSSLVKPMAAHANVHFLTRVMGVDRDGAAWRVRSSFDPNGELFDVVISTVPAPQAQAFFKPQSDIAKSIAPASMTPCWTLLVTFDSQVQCGFDVWQAKDEDLQWAARNTSKPGRNTSKDCWVVHASPDWSDRHLELDPELAGRKLLECFATKMDCSLPGIEYVTAHRWRYARTTTPLGAPFYSTPDCTLFIGGDWCLGDRVENAFESGTAIGNAVLDALR